MSILQRTTATASTYRRTGNERTESLHLSGLAVVPPFPGDWRNLGMLQQEGVIQTIYNVFETFVAGSVDVLVGDFIEINGERYTVRSVADWGMRPIQPVTHLTIEKVRK